jgi:hypothetical protein
VIKSTNQEVFSGTLRMAVLADEIAYSLRHVSQRRQLESRDVRAISAAEELLTEILRGREATKNRKVEESLEASLAYGQAIQAVQLNPTKFASFDSFEKLVDSLAKQLREIKAARSFEVDDLYEFFSAIRELAMAGGSRTFEFVNVSGVE